jgi:hypothetical protein
MDPFVSSNEDSISWAGKGRHGEREVGLRRPSPTES